MTAAEVRALSTGDAHERSACVTLPAHVRFADTLSPRLQFSRRQQSYRVRFIFSDGCRCARPAAPALRPNPRVTLRFAVAHALTLPHLCAPQVATWPSVLSDL